MSDSTFTLTGTVESVGRTQSFGQKGFTKREFVILPDTEDGSSSKYPNYVPFQLRKDKCSIGDSLNNGDHVTVKFVISGRKWDSPDKGTRYFTDLVALAVTPDATAARTTKTPSVPEAPAEAAYGPSEEDEMPF